MILRPSARVARRFVLGVAIVAVAASPALAQTTTSTGLNVGSVIQNVIGLLTNNVVRGLAIIAVIVTGITAMFGHLDLRRAGHVNEVRRSREGRSQPVVGFRRFG
ncbi:TrbC/VirB2 family protein [Phenylobacterium sp.]|uniref:TrbC/VirB2 family protein n=1 Tax=Phenylobacterium sp. TaxID=1871053 RepID=UPI001218DA59|nr:TrbC/VirB2 family protein [Phenylobacterium sp.]THD60596.1 MAG: type IV secretion system protein VirB2 [Phenylobacterium sp.]